MSDGDAIFEDKSHVTTEGVSPEAPEKSEVARDDAGRFAPKDKGEAEPSASEAAPPAAVEREPHAVPLSAVLDERERRQRAEAQLAMLQRRIAEQQSQQQVPDPVENAADYTRYVQGNFERQLMATKLQQSEFFARDKFGDALVDEALQFFDENPQESHRFIHEPSPFHAAVKFYEQQKQVRERSAPDFEEKLRAKIRAEIEAELRGPRPSPAIRPSLATATGSRGAPPVSAGDPLFD